MTIDEFIQRELETTGKRLFTIDEVIEMTERWIELKKATAKPFQGWKSDAAVDALLGIEGIPV